VRELELVEAVSAEDLQRVATAYLGDHNVTVGRFVPESGSADATGSST
jgi:predicted Zn-dependent peptidase